jgi:hypothetical protein
MPAYLDRAPERHTWTFSGSPVTQLVVDSASVRLQAWTLDATVELRLESPFRFTDAERGRVDVDPAAAVQVAPMLALLGVGLRRMILRRDGELVVEFASGALIEAAPDAGYEAYEVQVDGPGGRTAYLAMPGGAPLWGEDGDGRGDDGERRG